MWQRPRFSELRPLTKIYVGVFVVAAWVALAGLLGLLGLRTLGGGRLLFVIGGPGVVAVAAVVEKFVMRIAERKRQADKSVQSQN